MDLGGSGSLAAILGAVVVWLLKLNTSQRREIRNLNKALREAVANGGRISARTDERLAERTDPGGIGGDD